MVIGVEWGKRLVNKMSSRFVEDDALAPTKLLQQHTSPDETKKNSGLENIFN
jgi:hypothetical protein